MIEYITPLPLTNLYFTLYSYSHHNILHSQCQEQANARNKPVRITGFLEIGFLENEILEIKFNKNKIIKNIPINFSLQLVL